MKKGEFILEKEIRTDFGIVGATIHLPLVNLQYLTYLKKMMDEGINNRDHHEGLLHECKRVIDFLAIPEVPFPTDEDIWIKKPNPSEI